MSIETYFRGIGASNHTDKDREINDYYATPPAAIDCLLEKATLDKNIWECACGQGHISKRLIELGYNVKSTDLIDRGYGVGGWTSSVYGSLFAAISSQIRPTNWHRSFANTL